MDVVENLHQLKPTIDIQEIGVLARVGHANHVVDFIFADDLLLNEVQFLLGFLGSTGLIVVFIQDG